MERCQPQEDKYEWSKIDNLLKLAKEHDKSVILRISTAGSDLESMSDTPDWVIESDVKTLSFKDPAGKDHKMPIFWDSTYLAKWSNFVQDLGARYDKNPAIHSIGITGGGVEGGTLVVPELNVPINKENYKALETTLTKDHGMSQRQLVEHWKYVAELFPKAFPTQRLNFNIDPPTPNRAGQDSLDEISRLSGLPLWSTRLSLSHECERRQTRL
ncbi:MAG: beta-galactosidase [Candidatus Obscuribacter sp.]|nr:beta-galactosidase [Candidatus Obscuribacter sp.]